jgi:DNA-binding transcriptional regulator YiaG
MITREQAVAAIERHDNEIEQRLRDAQVAVEEAERAAAEAKEIRAGIISEAREGGWSFGRMAPVFGVSRQAVAQWADDRAGDATD